MRQVDDAGDAAGSALGGGLGVGVRGPVGAIAGAIANAGVGYVEYGAQRLGALNADAIIVRLTGCS